MDRAKIVAGRPVPPSVVQMGSTVEFHSDDGKDRRVTLVFPGDADIAAGKISILTVSPPAPAQPAQSAQSGAN